MCLYVQSSGASGMTILEELIEFALLACERGRASIAGAAATASSHHNTSRGAAALGPDGKVYTGFDIVPISVNGSFDGYAMGGAVPAERGAFLAAVAAGCPKFQVSPQFKTYEKYCI